MLDTGMRPEEVCRLRWEHVQLQPVNGSQFGFLHNPTGKTKYAKRNLSLTPRVQSLLSMRHEDAGKPAKGWVFPATDEPKKHVPYSTIDSQHDRTMKKLSEADAEGNKPKNPISPFRLYDLRHTCLTRFGAVNTDPFTIQKIAGHASITMTQRYVHPTPEHLENAFARLDAHNQANVVETPEAERVMVN